MNSTDMLKYYLEQYSDGKCFKPVRNSQFKEGFSISVGLLRSDFEGVTLDPKLLHSKIVGLLHCDDEDVIFYQMVDECLLNLQVSQKLTEKIPQVIKFCLNEGANISLFRTSSSPRTSNVLLKWNDLNHLSYLSNLKKTLAEIVLNQPII